MRPSFDRNSQFQNFQDNSESSSSNAPKNQNTITPMTIKQILGLQYSEDEKFYVGKSEILTVIIVGRIDEFTSTTQKIQFKINDGTGKINAINWRPRASSKTDFKNGDLVRVIGKIRDWQGKTIAISHMSKISDFNAMTHHFLNVIYVYCVRTKGEIKKDVQMEDKPVAMIPKDDSIIKNVLEYVKNKQKEFKAGVTYSRIFSEFGNFTQKYELDEAIKYLLQKNMLRNSPQDEQVFLANTQ